MGEPRWLNEREQTAWRSYLEMQRQLQARLNSELQRHAGLSDADYEVLVNLTDEPTGRMRAFQLADAMRWEKSRLSHHLTRMERRGLVRRDECETDGRGAYVVITPAGRRAMRAAAPQHVDDVRRLFLDALTPEQLDTLHAVSTAVLERLAVE